MQRLRFRRESRSVTHHLVARFVLATRRRGGCRVSGWGAGQLSTYQIWKLLMASAGTYAAVLHVFLRALITISEIAQWHLIDGLGLGPSAVKEKTCNQFNHRVYAHIGVFQPALDRMLTSIQSINLFIFLPWIGSAWSHSPWIHTSLYAFSRCCMPKTAFGPQTLGPKYNL